MLGPVAAPMPKLRGNFRFQILCITPTQRAAGSGARGHRQLKAPEEVLWMVDVDPVDML